MCSGINPVVPFILLSPDLRNKLDGSTLQSVVRSCSRSARLAVLLVVCVALLPCSWHLHRCAHSHQGAGPGRAGRAWQEGAQPRCTHYAAAGQQLQRAGSGSNSCRATAAGAWNGTSLPLCLQFQLCMACLTHVPLTTYRLQCLQAAPSVAAVAPCHGRHALLPDISYVTDALGCVRW
jgi:hypothetical protein